MPDQHLTNTIIATAILDCTRHHRELIDPEEAKRIAKCVLMALADAGFEIAPAATN